MILLDANIFMYAAGAPHRYKAPSVRLLHRVAQGEVAATVDAEALQEILHRYRAMGRWVDGARVFELARTVVPDVVPITAAVLDRAKQLLDQQPTLLARDALHAAVVLEGGFASLCSYDRDFDAIPGIVRSEPD